VIEKRRIKLSRNFPYMPILRQTPNSSGIWGQYHFIADEESNEDTGPFDAWVVYNNLPNQTIQMASCAPERTVLILGEPPSRVDVHPDFASQFGKIVSCHPSITSLNSLHMQQALPWWVGLRRNGFSKFEALMGYDELAAMTSIPKTREISIICSSLAITPDHRLRLRFVKELTRHFGDRLDVFGEGRKPISDKWDAIAPFKYHIVLENSCVADYWTEKLADAFLGAAMPIYWGCPNIGRYFSPESMAQIDIANPIDAIQIIEQILAQDPYEKSKTAIWQARRKVLDEFNLFPMLARLVDELPYGEAKPLVIRPTGDFRPSPQMRFRRWGFLARECMARSWAKVSG